MNNEVKDSDIVPIARHDEGPLFEEAWNAEVLALAFSLAKVGVFSEKEWSAALADTLLAASKTGKPDNQDTYYGAALKALEQLLTSTGNLDESQVRQRQEAWRQAYQHTPHGQPVKLS